MLTIIDFLGGMVPWPVCCFFLKGVEMEFSIELLEL